MKPDSEQHEQLTAYLDGELPVAERARVERWLEQDSEARKLLEDLRRTSMLVSSLPRERLTADITDRVRTRLERESLYGNRSEDLAEGRPVRWLRGIALAACIVMVCSATYWGMVRLQEYRERRVFSTLADNEDPRRTNGARDADSPRLETKATKQLVAPVGRKKIAAEGNVQSGRSAPARTVPADHASDTGESLTLARGREVAPMALARPAPAAGAERRAAAPIYGQAVPANVEAEITSGDENEIKIEVDPQAYRDLASTIESTLASAQVPESALPAETGRATKRRWYRKHAAGEIGSAKDEGTLMQTVYDINVEAAVLPTILASIDQSSRSRIRGWAANGQNVSGGTEAVARLQKSGQMKNGAHEQLAMKAPTASLRAQTDTQSRANAASARGGAAGAGSGKMLPPEFVRLQIRVLTFSPPGPTSQGAPGAK